MTITVQLRKYIDPTMPVLSAKRLSDSKCGPVEIVEAHPVWRGCQLTRAQYRLIEDEQKWRKG
jgi:hypothetical protein